MIVDELKLMDLILKDEFKDASDYLFKCITSEKDEKKSYTNSINSIFMRGIKEIRIRKSDSGITKKNYIEKYLSFLEFFILQKRIKSLDTFYICKNLIRFLKDESLPLLVTLAWEENIKATLDILTSAKIFQDLAINTINSLTMPKKLEFLYELIKMCIEKYNVRLFTLLKNKFNINLDDLNLDKRQQEKLRLFSSIGDKEDLVMNFSYAYKNGYGNINYEAGLLSIAETSTRKKYIFMPTLLDSGTDDIDQYFETYKKIILPARERFIISGFHWICGEINIDKEGKVSCLLLDSLDSTSFDAVLSIIAHKIKETFPDCIMYVSNYKRQHSSAGCSVFALDDLRHLYTIESHLPLKYQRGGLYAYLEDSYKSNGDILISHPDTQVEMTARQCSLPLPFMRTTQTSSLWSEVIPARDEDEQKQSVNKKKEGILVALAKHSEEKVVTTEDKTIKKNVNFRLDYKLKKMGEYVISFIINNSKEKIRETSQQFTVAGFKQRHELTPIKENKLAGSELTILRK